MAMLISANASPKPNSWKLWLIALLALLAFVFIILLILGLTVFKPKNAVTTVNSVSLEGFHVSLDVPRVRVDLNVTLAVDLSVNNPNKVGFKYKNSTALLFYKGDVIVGEAPIVSGYIAAGETIGMNLTLTLLADRLLSDSEVYSNVMNDRALPVTSYTRISGTVVVLKVFKHRVVSYSWCDLVVNLANSTVSNSDCRYKTKF